MLTGYVDDLKNKGITLEDYFVEMIEQLKVITGLSSEPDAALERLKAIMKKTSIQTYERASLYLDFYKIMIFDRESVICKSFFDDSLTKVLDDSEKKQMIECISIGKFLLV